MIDSKLQIVSNQVQYSIIDRRPEVQMVPFCLKNNISLLAYGSLCGGLMSEHYLERIQPSTAELNTLSLRKYKKMIDAWGGWSLFQELLSIDSMKVKGLRDTVTMLDKSDCDAIDDVCTKSNDLFETMGDCGDEYR